MVRPNNADGTKLDYLPNTIFLLGIVPGVFLCEAGRRGFLE
jgi:hypothetical protein